MINAYTKIQKFFEQHHLLATGRVKLNVSMKSYTTFRCPGIVDVVYMPRDRQDLSLLVQKLGEAGFVYRKDWNVMGRGSNVLISDQGYRGCLLDLSGDFDQITVLERHSEELRIKVETGVANGTLLQYLRNKEWSGFEFAFGIPGCIGGGIRMNAGTPQGWFADILEKVEMMDTRGIIEEIKVHSGHFKYRDFPLSHDKIILSGTFFFQKAPSFVIQEKIDSCKDQRKNQPLEFPNIGSVFKNPEGSFAGKLIENAGLKGLRIGDAQISEKHANFIINLGNAKTSDVLALIKRAQDEVQSQFNIHLEPEVHVIK